MDTTKLGTWRSWRPPVFKIRGSGLAAKVCTSALGVAVAAVTLDIVSEKIKKDTDVSPFVRRLVSFVAAFVAGVISYLILWFFFGLS
jgi:hypothetical protein